MDALTAEIMRHLETLPLAKKQAVLELVKPAQNGHYRTEKDTWRERWATAPIMTSREQSEIEAIHNEFNDEVKGWENTCY